WQRFERWVAGSPAVGGDSEAYRNRVRALVWARMGQNAAAVPDVGQLADLPPFLKHHPLRPRPLSPGAGHCFRQSLELAPDRLEAYTALLELYRQEQKSKEALGVARQLLERFPDHV